MGACECVTRDSFSMYKRDRQRSPPPYRLLTVLPRPKEEGGAADSSVTDGSLGERLRPRSLACMTAWRARDSGEARSAAVRGVPLSFTDY